MGTKKAAPVSVVGGLEATNRERLTVVPEMIYKRLLYTVIYSESKWRRLGEQRAKLCYLGSRMV